MKRTIRYFHFFNNSWGWKELFLTQGRFTNWEPNEYFFPNPPYHYTSCRFIFKTKREPNADEWTALNNLPLEGAPLRKKDTFIL